MVKGLVEGTLSTPAYEAMLRGYHAFFSPMEAEMQARHPAIVNELGGFRFEKTRWLGEDLAILGQGIAVPSLAAFPLPDDLAGLAGCLYVVEGSTLGGMHLSRSGRGFPRNAGRFFEGYGEQTIPAWKTFIEWLDASINAAEEIRAAETANQVFDWFGRAFTSLAHDRESMPRRKD